MVKILKLGNISADLKLATILWAVVKDTEKIKDNNNLVEHQICYL